MKRLTCLNFRDTCIQCVFFVLFCFLGYGRVREDDEDSDDDGSDEEIDESLVNKICVAPR